MIVIQIIAGWLLADFISGVFHWWEDRVGSEDTPILGQAVVKWNRIHHRNPSLSLKGGFWYRNRDPIIASLVVSIILVLIFGFSYWWASMTVGLIVATQVHYWSHKNRQNKIVNMLQKFGIFQSPTHHGKHHMGNQDTRYCVLTNFLNPALDKIRFWFFLEYILTGIGREPNRGTK